MQGKGVQGTWPAVLNHAATHDKASADPLNAGFEPVPSFGKLRHDVRMVSQ